jgi:hypothetical protein
MEKTFIQHIEYDMTTIESYTENGALAYRTTGKSLLDFNFMLPSFRGNVEKAKESLRGIRNPYLLKYLFFLRDVREGLGERDTFRGALQVMAENRFYGQDAEAILSEAPTYGRYDDLLVLLDTGYRDTVTGILKAQLEKDLAAMGSGKPVSLLAKWMPSDNATSSLQRHQAFTLAKAFGMTIRDYRHTLVSLRQYLGIPETKMTQGRWQDIDYSTLSSNANIRYADAFMKHDHDRRQSYLASLVDSHDGSFRINARVLFPYEIVQHYLSAFDHALYDFPYDASLEVLWKALPDKGMLEDTLVVRDGSGSMESTIGNSHMTAQCVADSITLYAADHLKGAFHDKAITFSSCPEFLDFTGLSSLQRMLIYLLRFDDCSNTDIKAVFDLVLRTAIRHQVPQEDMPKRILIISDMEFDACSHVNAPLFEVIAQSFRDAGYRLPKLVFWNVNSRTNALPMVQNDAGVILISGFSLALFEQVTGGVDDPYRCLISLLSKKRYDAIPLLDQR